MALLLHISLAITKLPTQTNTSVAEAIQPPPAGLSYSLNATKPLTQMNTNAPEEPLPARHPPPSLQTGSSRPSSGIVGDPNRVEKAGEIPSSGGQSSDWSETFIDANARYSLPVVPPGGFLQHNLTVVTAYFEVPSRHTRAEYFYWMENMLCMDLPMVIFTEPGLVDHIRSVRSSLVPQAELKTIMVATTMDEFRVMNVANASEFWIRQAQMDPERGIHKGHKVLLVWDEKVNFLTTVIDRNPFDSEWFFWVDVGSQRWGAKNCQSRFDELPTRVITDEFSTESVVVTYVDDTIAGGSFGGREDAVRRMETAFYKKMDNGRRQGTFVGKEQDLFKAMCMDDPDLFEILEGDGAWFLVADYVGGALSDEPSVIYPCMR